MADDNYLGQLLAEPREDSMEPIGIPLAHVVQDRVGTGAIIGFATEVPTVKPINKEDTDDLEIPIYYGTVISKIELNN